MLKSCVNALKMIQCGRWPLRIHRISVIAVLVLLNFSVGYKSPVCFEPMRSTRKGKLITVSTHIFSPLFSKLRAIALNSDWTEF